MKQINNVKYVNDSKGTNVNATYYALDKFLGIETKDWSTDYLERTNKYKDGDTRISDRKAKRELNTQPTIALKNMIGKYKSNLGGNINIIEKNNQLELVFENSPLLSASLSHWHHDVWEIHWDHDQAWFSFGTIKINTDNNLEVIGFDFDVPNDDFFFEELKPFKI